MNGEQLDSHHPAALTLGGEPVPDDMLEFDLQTVGDATVLAVTGEIDMHTAPTFTRALRAALARDTSTVVVDMSGVDFLASTGLSALVRAEEDARAHGAVFRIAGGTRSALRAIEAAGLLEVLHHHRTVAEATA